MKASKLFFIFSICLMVIGCGIGGIKGDLKRGLDNYYSERPPFVDIYEYGGFVFPINMPKNGSAFTDYRLGIFIKAGLLTRHEVYDPNWATPSQGQENVATGLMLNLGASTSSSRQANKMNAWRYDLTEEGKKFYTKYKGPGEYERHAGFIFAQVKVIKIIDYSEPTDMEGHIISKVKYLIQAQNVPNWANTEEFRNFTPEIKTILDSQSTPLEQQAVLVKMASGWVHSDLVQ